MKIYLKIFLPVLILFSAVNNLHAQDEALLVAGIKKVFDIFNSGDYTHLGEFIDENFVDHSPMQGQKPGLAGLKEMFESMKKGYPDMKFAINDIIVNSACDKAAVLITFTGTNTGEMMGMKPTGKSVNVMGIDYLYFKNGKATEHWGYMDMETMMKQLGMTPEGDMNK